MEAEAETKAEEKVLPCITVPTVPPHSNSRLPPTPRDNNNDDDDDDD